MGHLSKRRAQQVVRGQPFRSNLFWLGALCVCVGGGEGEGMLCSNEHPLSLSPKKTLCSLAKIEIFHTHAPLLTEFYINVC